MTTILDATAGLGLYDLWANRNLKGMHDFLIKLANLDGNKQVLDVGGGRGVLASLFVEALRTIAIYGIDIGPRMIKISKKRAQENDRKISYEVGSALKLPHTKDKPVFQEEGR